jgi:hypothetical protein
MIKIILAVLTLLCSLNAVASEYQVLIENESSKEVSFGVFKGISLPSFCDTGAGYSFCWAEVNVKFKAFNQDTFNIEPRAKVGIRERDFEDYDFYLNIQGTDKKDYRQINIASCRQTSDRVEEIKDVFYLDSLSSSIYCINPGAVRIIVKD